MNLFERIIEKLYLGIDGNLVYFDGLTKAKNRLYFDKVVKPKYEHERCMIIFIDIDNLKTFNDLCGHETGDKRIKEVANDLMNLSGTYDVCRIGGDEFVVIANPDFDINLLKLVAGVSHGYSIKEKTDNISVIMKKADKLMYENKTAKKLKR